MKPAIAVVSFALIFAPRVANAHGMRTAYLEIVEGTDHSALVRVRIPTRGATLQPRAPLGCTIAPSGEAAAGDTASYLLACDGSLRGKEIAVDGLGPLITEAVVRLVLADGTTLSHLAQRDSPAWRVPRDQSAIEVALDYVGLGVVHILTGGDHLLFLVALVLLVRRPRAVLLTESAFTVSHSLSFSATTLGLVHISSYAAEAAIALSLVLLALDVLRSRGRSMDAKRSALIALVFGLVHGLGFAGGLSEIGLPDGAIGMALVGFGMGVEIGQVAFLIAVMLVFYALERMRLLERAMAPLGYAVGTVGAFWLWQRLWLCFIANA
jgi:hydrogenase/urease accessory protein HupE